ncbi:hypothetical protein NIES22_71860 (plasmid) [Calothrix brevissima NIES-22]|nr:hypothetical protein NIES22_71860 [Calothrix brevissima NIES-22]
MSRWDDERREMMLHSLFITFNPVAYLLGMAALGFLGGLYIWFKPTSNISPQPKQLETATDYVDWGYKIMNADMPEIARINPERRQANCKTALQYFEKAIALNSKLAFGYQGRGMSLICQNNKQAGRQSLAQAKDLYLKQGNKQEANNIDIILTIYSNPI